jgi:hypothetical protein
MHEWWYFCQNNNTMTTWRCVLSKSRWTSDDTSVKITIRWLHDDVSCQSQDERVTNHWRCVCQSQDERVMMISLSNSRWIVDDDSMKRDRKCQPCQRACMPALLQLWYACKPQLQSHKMKIACWCVCPSHKMLIACRCVSRTHTVMMSWWVHRVKRACTPAVLKRVHASRVKERAWKP